MSLIQITKDNYEKEVMRKDLPVIVDFWAEWCGPCKMIGPIFADLAKDYNEKMIFAKVDVDTEREIAAKHNIMSIPTIIVFKNGQEVSRITGFRPKETLREEIESKL